MAWVGLLARCCQTPDLGLGLGVDFTFQDNNNNKKNHKKKKNPHLIFQRSEGARGLKFGTQTWLITIFGSKNILVLNRNFSQKKNFESKKNFDPNFF